MHFPHMNMANEYIWFLRIEFITRIFAKYRRIHLWVLALLSTEHCSRMSWIGCNRNLTKQLTLFRIESANTGFAAKQSMKSHVFYTKIYPTKNCYVLVRTSCTLQKLVFRSRVHTNRLTQHNLQMYAVLFRYVSAIIVHIFNVFRIIVEWKFEPEIVTTLTPHTHTQ